MTPSSVSLGSDPWLFVDRALIERESGTRLQLHPPVRRETVWTPQSAWEGDVSWFPHVIKDGARFRLWYWARRGRSSEGTSTGPAYCAYMESPDGIQWERPNLGLVPFEGSTDNNLMWPIPGHTSQFLAVFKDANPDVPEEERYKALGRGGSTARRGLWGLVSSDGLHWRDFLDRTLMESPPDNPMFDSPNVAFWDLWRREYAIYARGATPFGTPPDLPGIRRGDYFTRRVRRTASPDFRHWAPFEYLDLHQAVEPREQFYTNATVAYERSRNLYFMFPMRYVLERKRYQEWALDGLSDVAFLSSRDGVHWDRPFPEAWIPPGRDQGNWHERSMAVGRGIVQTGEDELSLYVNENFRLPSARFVRYSVRLDGFASVNAPMAGGEFVTPPLSFAGDAMEINHATSALGSIQVEIQSETGVALPGFELASCDLIYGDDIDRRVSWGGSTNVATLAGRPIRLRFALRDAHLYALRFRTDVTTTDS